MHQQLATALDAYKPEIAAAFARIVKNQFGLAQRALGPELKNIGNDWTWAAVWTTTLARFVTRDCDKVATIDDARLAHYAAFHADEVIAAWKGKIELKLGEMDDAVVMDLGGCVFRITGRRNGHDVLIEQTMIINVSSKGKVFNQFPARIYLDGKATSEAKYKKLMVA